MVKINIKGQNVYCKKKGSELKSINSNSTDKNIKIISVGRHVRDSNLSFFEFSKAYPFGLSTKNNEFGLI
jgi:hypothetical protein